MKKKFPANFTDLVLIGLIAWLVKDWGDLINAYLFLEIDNFEWFKCWAANFKALIGVIIFFFRMKYNSKMR